MCILNRVLNHSDYNNVLSDLHILKNNSGQSHKTQCAWCLSASYLPLKVHDLSVCDFEAWYNCEKSAEGVFAVPPIWRKSVESD